MFGSISRCAKSGSVTCTNNKSSKSGSVICTKKRIAPPKFVGQFQNSQLFFFFFFFWEWSTKFWEIPSPPHPVAKLQQHSQTESNWPLNLSQLNRVENSSLSIVSDSDFFFCNHLHPNDSTKVVLVFGVVKTINVGRWQVFCFHFLQLTMLSHFCSSGLLLLLLLFNGWMLSLDTR